MLDVFVCHAAGDREVAAAIQARLERGAECRVWTEECGGETVAELWDSGLSCAAIVLILSRESVPSTAGRSAWEGLLEHVGRIGAPPVGCVVVGDCRYPSLLDRRNLFRWGGGAKETLRALERWVLSLHGDGARAAFAPARLEWLEGHRAWAVAQEFAREAGDHFRDVIWVDCEGRSRDSILGEVAGELGTTAEEAPAVIAAHRVLVVLDSLAGEPVMAAPAEERGSVLITSRRRWERRARVQRILSR